MNRHLHRGYNGPILVTDIDETLRPGYILRGGGPMKFQLMWVH